MRVRPPYAAGVRCRIRLYRQALNYRNSYFAKIGGISTQEMNSLELNFLFLMGFKLQVSVSVFESYCRHLEREVSFGGGYQIERSLISVCASGILSEKKEKRQVKQLAQPLPLEDAARSDVQRSIEVRFVSGGKNLSSRPVDEEEADLDSVEKPMLKPLHWDQVQASSDRATVWVKPKSSSFHLDMIEALFVNNSTAPPPKEWSRRVILPPLKQEDR
ncbi:hypothetical protein M5K25_007804 [Dendrobium thyrsiflorum]|uniref:Uncharacterized protein n=1 Tax=Dendrobium thyrsiflorum TaxID=117978 RepID=A0ABD0VG88_DENTH